jgi:hypothetical protein
MRGMRGGWRGRGKEGLKVWRRGWVQNCDGERRQQSKATYGGWGGGPVWRLGEMGIVPYRENETNVAVDEGSGAAFRLDQPRREHPRQRRERG